MGAVFPHFCPDKREIWHGDRGGPLLREKFHVFTGEKANFGPLSKNNTGMAALCMHRPAGNNKTQVLQCRFLVTSYEHNHIANIKTIKNSRNVFIDISCNTSVKNKICHFIMYRLFYSQSCGYKMPISAQFTDTMKLNSHVVLHLVTTYKQSMQTKTKCKGCSTGMSCKSWQVLWRTIPVVRQI